MLSNDEKEGMFVFLIVICIALALFVVSVMFSQTEVGDVQTTQHNTEVYSSYQPGKLGDLVCILPKGTDVVIVEIFSSNDIPGAEKGAFGEIKAFRISTPECSGWVLPEDID